MQTTYAFTGLVAFVTGAGQGIGLAAAQAYAAAGAIVVMTDATEATVRIEAEKIVASGGKAIGLMCDVSDEAQVVAAIECTISQYGRLDMAFNNAGVQAPSSDIADQSAKDFDRLIDINLRGTWACMKHQLKHMRVQGSGAIVNMASVGGLVAHIDLAPYNASKHGIIGLTKSAALRYAKQNIRINCVCPGTIETAAVADMIKKRPESLKEMVRRQAIGRLGKAEEIAAAVMWLSSDDASFVHGIALPVDGGFMAG